ncbi:MAG TPA: VWA domain-containing protein [Vicinamibacterales bacterium]|nr:VWA domain-containing protein [Vicinamibacterales bacterium]
MKTLRSIRVWAALAVTLALAYAGLALHAQERQQGDAPFRFRTGVELINVTATVTDANGRFVAGLRKEDFRVYQDDQLQQITHFNNERVPVSLGIILDTSGSMSGEKMHAAKEALNRFLLDLLREDDEVFLYRFDSSPELVHEWTTDRRRVSRALDRIQAKGGTAMYDAVAEAIPLAQAGRHRKKALVIISDGNDTSSRTPVDALKAQIRETEVLVYAIGIDAQVPTEEPFRRLIGGALGSLMQSKPIPFPFPRPGGTRPPPSRPLPPTNPPRFPPGTPPVVPPVAAPRNPHTRVKPDDRVNAAALREITDDSGGRTEVVRSARDLHPATAGIADELSRQYYLGYTSNAPRDGRWHSIRVEVRDGRYTVRARRGFVATP